MKSWISVCVSFWFSIAAGSGGEIPALINFQGKLASAEVGERFEREFSIKLRNSFLDEVEDFVLTITLPVDLVSITVIGFAGSKFTDVKGEVNFGELTARPQRIPSVSSGSTIEWHIGDVQLGESYRLIWRHSSSTRGG